MNKLAIFGGEPIRKDPLIFGKPDLTRGHEIEYVTNVLKSGWIGNGPVTEKFELELGKYLNNPHIITTTSATSGLLLSFYMIAHRLGKVNLDGYEIITTPYTFVATIEAIIRSGAKPVFVDIDYNTHNIDTNLIEKKITAKTVAIVPVHVAGLPAELDHLISISNKYKLFVVEDAAHALEAYYKNRKIGSISDFTVFSFYANKNITTGEGGAVAVKDKSLYRIGKKMSMHGMTKTAYQRLHNKESIIEHPLTTYLGYKCNMNDIEAAIGLAQLESIDEKSHKRKLVWDRYNKQLSRIKTIEIPTINRHTKHAMHLYQIKLKTNDSRKRDQIANALKHEGIHTGIHYYPPVHLHPFFKKYLKVTSESSFPNSIAVSNNTISLPLTPYLTANDVNDVIKALNKVLDQLS